MDSWTLLSGAFLACLVSGVVPLVNAEIVVVTAATLIPGGLMTPLVVICSLGQMLSKLGIYACARWAPSLLPPRVSVRLDGVGRRVGDRKRTQSVAILASASLGLPPLYLVTVACGLLRVNSLVFLGAGLVGRAVRFGVLAIGAVTGVELLGLLPGWGG